MLNMIIKKYIYIFAVFFVLFGANVYAAAIKHDVCHYDITSGEYHVINISFKALSAHEKHGDALPGESVPTNPGFVFDESCQQQLASTCPCDYSAEALATIGIDGSQPACVNDIPGQTFGIRVIGENTSVYVNEESALFCGVASNGLLLEGFPLDALQLSDCKADIEARADELGIETVQICL